MVEIKETKEEFTPPDAEEITIVPQDYTNRQLKRYKDRADTLKKSAPTVKYGRNKDEPVDDDNDTQVTEEAFKQYLLINQVALNALSRRLLLYGYRRYQKLRNERHGSMSEAEKAALFLSTAGNKFIKGKKKLNPGTKAIIKHFYKCFKHLEFNEKDYEELHKCPRTTTADSVKFIESKDDLNYFLNNPVLLVRVICRLLYETGLRRNELVFLERKHIVLEQNMIKADNFGKRGKNIRVFFSTKTAEDVKKWITAAPNKTHPFWLPSRRNPNYKLKQPEHLLWEIISNEGKKLGIRVTPHSFRHMLGRDLRIKAKADLEQIRQIMRHDDIKTTQIYTKSTEEEVKEVMESFLNPKKQPKDMNDAEIAQMLDERQAKKEEKEKENLMKIREKLDMEDKNEEESS